MLTHTPLDLTPFGPLLSAFGLLYWGLALGLAGLALWLPKRWRIKVPLAATVLTAFVYPVATHVRQERQRHDEAKAKLDAATALFNERCKTAGEKIARTVENVNGVVWMKWRDAAMNYDDQFKLDDPYGRDCGAEDCIAGLLRVTLGEALNPEEAARHSRGYRYVENTDPVDGGRYRYSARMEQSWTQKAIDLYRKENRRDDLPKYSFRFKIYRSPAEKSDARYGITWDDISTREDRQHWIAGSSLKVVDLQTNELIAERVGYMMDRGQGSKAGFRSPWLEADKTSCPPFERSESNASVKSSRSRAFIFKVLHAAKGE
jgi:hypothetical protein